jgi:hypothetical protein
MSDKDFLAIIQINGGSSWARSTNKSKAISSVARIFKSDWKRLFKLEKGDERTVELVDVTGYDDISWGYNGIFYKNADGTKGQIDESRVEYVKVKLP